MDHVLVEPLDAGALWGVFATEEYSPEPRALFRSETDAADYVAWLGHPNNPDASGCDYCVLPVFVQGVVANHAPTSDAIAALTALHPTATWRSDAPAPVRLGLRSEDWP